MIERLNGLTAKRAREVFDYDSLTGRLFWKIDKGSRAHTGEEAGCICHLGRRFYSKVRIDGKQYFAHRIIWLFAYGYLPNEIDHWDGDSLNNRIDNLREVTHQENCRNERKPRNNTSGVLGVSWIKARAKWMASIKISGQSIHLGWYGNFQDAVAARKTADKRYGFSPNHGWSCSDVQKPKKSQM